MYPVDPASAFALCGAGSLVASVLLRPSIANDAATVGALRVGRIAFAAIGVGLVQIVVNPVDLPLWSQAAMSVGGVSGVLMVGWALALLGGGSAPRALRALSILLVLAAALVAWPFGTPGMTWFCTLGLLVASTSILGLGWRVVLRPREVNERLLGLSVLLMTAASWLRASFLLVWEGPYPVHLLYVPPALEAPFMLVYGTLPVVFATLMLNVVNVRLQAGLHLRATTDFLTGALTRQALADSVAPMTERLEREGHAVAVVMIDLDHFKSINDRNGHAIGDAVLRQTAEVLRRELRADALLARYGGEEFVALVPSVDLPVARRVAERLRQAMEAARWPLPDGGTLAVTVSIGVTLLARDESLAQALERADEALYRAKRGGRNQVQVALEAA